MPLNTDMIVWQWSLKALPKVTTKPTDFGQPSIKSNDVEQIQASYRDNQMNI